MNIAVLITCHNRREKTLRGLQSLVRASEQCEQLGVDVFLVDDGSTDGTNESVREWFASISTRSTEHEARSTLFNLHLIRGSGSLFWAKGMALAWQSAIDYEEQHLAHLPTTNHQLPTSFSHFLWLNDDVELFDQALDSLFHAGAKGLAPLPCVVVGETCDREDHTKKTYGLQGRWFNGNVVLVPREVCDKVGIIDDHYSHAKADFDYAERVHRAGVPIVAAEGFVGTCADDWREKLRGKNLFARLALLFRPSNFNLHDLWRFQSRYFGNLHALGCCLKLFWQVSLFPHFAKCGNRKKIIHVCDGWQESNGAANIARLIAREQQAAGCEVALRRWAGWRELRSADEVWIHCGWKPCLWWAALCGRHVKWMPEACYDSVRLNYHGWKKRLVGPIERWALRRCDVLVATCEAEKDWIQSYLHLHLKPTPKIEITDIKRFFKLDTPIVRPKTDRHLEPLHVLYLGRRHPLKGVEYLEQAVRELNDTWHKYQPNTPLPIELKIVSNAFGDEKEKVWSWCDVLCLPTLSDNLGLVIAEALEHGRSVITTDGAPAWKDFHSLTYLRGFRDGTDAQRVALLKDALKQYVD